MELDAYLPMFLAESREHLEHLNLAVVRVEEQPDDRETVDEIFRIAHSFKGMSATMGFAATAALTHKMEDVFELLRQRRGGLDRKAIDVLLECLDALEGAVDGIEQDVDDLALEAARALAQQLEDVLHLVRERRHPGEAHRRAHALQRVRDAEDLVDRGAVVGALLDGHDGQGQLLQVLAGLRDEHREVLGGVHQLLR